LARAQLRQNHAEGGGRGRLAGVHAWFNEFKPRVNLQPNSTAFNASSISLRPTVLTIASTAVYTAFAPNSFKDF
jgi:hypothetical protein